MDEWQLLELIQGRVPAAGDDCAVLPFRDTCLLLTTDMLHRASDFPPGTTPYTIGWRSVAASLSDIAAMGGRPLAVVLAASAPSWEGVFDGVLSGAQDACEEVGTRLVGGDLDSSRELFLTSTALGEAARPVLRSGARPGDLLCLSGPLGRTAAALHFFEQGRLEEANRLFRFIPGVKEGLKLSSLVTSMIDISDGLAHSVHLLARASEVGFLALEKALYFGEDYELLYTMPPKLFRPELGIPIGEAVEGGVWLVQEGKREKLPDRGWAHGG